MSRLWEIDAARTAAVAMMVVFHTVYDVSTLAPSLDVDPFGGGWRALQVATGSSFLFLVGVSAAVSNARARRRGRQGADLWRHHARRALQVLAAAMLVSMATFVALGSDDYVRFGVLHCIAAVMVILPLLVPLGPWPTALLALPVIVAGKLLEETAVHTSVFVVLGWRPVWGAGIDYYPLLPWLGVGMLGLAAGLLLYPGGERGPFARRTAGRVAPGARTARLTWPGRHALPVYLVHQLVLLAVVALVLTVLGVDVDL